MSGPYFNRGGASAGPAPVRAFDGKASVMTANRLTKEGETMRIHAKVKKPKKPQSLKKYSNKL